jgi:hypothetical protein
MRWHTIFTIGIAGILLAAGALAMSANSLWEKQLDRGGSDAVRGMAAGAPRVLAVGPTNSVGHSDSLSADLLWENKFNRGSLDAVRAMVAEGPRVFAVGPTNAVGNSDMGIVAYDVGDGTILWQKHYDREGCDDEAKAAAKAPGRIFVAGYTQTRLADGNCAREQSEGILNNDFSVVAFDSQNGRLVWQSNLNGIKGDREVRREDAALGIAVAGKWVFAVGYVNASWPGSPGEVDNFTIRAYDTSRKYGSGVNVEPTWQSVYTETLKFENGVRVRGCPVTNGGRAVAVATDGDHVYVVGRTRFRRDLPADQDPECPPIPDPDECPYDEVGEWKDWTVVAYDLEGNALWDHRYRRPSACGGAEASAVVAAEGRVFVGGATFAVNDDGDYTHGDFSVVAYNGTDGTHIWSDDYDRARGSDGVWAEGSITVLGDRVFAAGVATVRHGDAYNTDWLVRAYEAGGDGAGNPRLLWTDIYETGAGDDHAAWIAASGEKVFVAGSTVLGQSGANASRTAWLVRAYDARGGGFGNVRVLWQDLWDEPEMGEAAALVVYGSSVIVGGAVWPLAEGQPDFGVRAYHR